MVLLSEIYPKNCKLDVFHCHEVCYKGSLQTGNDCDNAVGLDTRMLTSMKEHKCQTPLNFLIYRIPNMGEQILLPAQCLMAELL